MQELCSTHYYTYRAVAKITGFSVRTLQRYVKRGRLLACAPLGSRSKRFLGAEITRFMSGDFTAPGTQQSTQQIVQRAMTLAAKARKEVNVA